MIDSDIIKGLFKALGLAGLYLMVCAGFAILAM